MWTDIAIGFGFLASAIAKLWDVRVGRKGMPPTASQALSTALLTFVLALNALGHWHPSCLLALNVASTTIMASATVHDIQRSRAREHGTAATGTPSSTVPPTGERP